jgi:hypothetical protein
MPKGVRKIWSREDLLKAVAESCSMSDVYRKLGYPHQTGTLERIISELDIDTSHFAQRKRYTDNELRLAISNVHSLEELAKTLGYSRITLGIARDIARLHLNTDHFNRKIQEKRKFMRVVSSSASISEISLKMGVSRPAVRKFAAKFGISLPRKNNGMKTIIDYCNLEE